MVYRDCVLLSRRSPPSTVLVAEDNDDTREVYAEYLRYCEFEVTTAVDGNDALAKIRANPLVLDLTIPGLDGWSVARAVKADVKTKAVRIIAVTGQTMKGARAAAEAAGVDAFLTKPCLPEDLVDEIAAQVRNRRA